VVPGPSHHLKTIVVAEEYSCLRLTSDVSTHNVVDMIMVSMKECTLSQGLVPAFHHTIGTSGYVVSRDGRH
jgi:hypothetical protein